MLAGCQASFAQGNLSTFADGPKSYTQKTASDMEKAVLADKAVRDNLQKKCEGIHSDLNKSIEDKASKAAKEFLVQYRICFKEYRKARGDFYAMLYNTSVDVCDKFVKGHYHKERCEVVERHQDSPRVAMKFIEWIKGFDDYVGQLEKKIQEIQ